MEITFALVHLYNCICLYLCIIGYFHRKCAVSLTLLCHKKNKDNNFQYTVKIAVFFKLTLGF